MPKVIITSVNPKVDGEYDLSLPLKHGDLHIAKKWLDHVFRKLDDDVLDGDDHFALALAAIWRSGVTITREHVDALMQADLGSIVIDVTDIEVVEERPPNSPTASGEENKPSAPLVESSSPPSSANSTPTDGEPSGSPLRAIGNPGSEGLAASG